MQIKQEEAIAPEKRKHHDAKSQARAEDAKTQTDSMCPQSQSHLDIFNCYIPNLKELVDQQHSIAAKVSEGTFTADKLIRLLSNCLKVLKNYRVVSNSKGLEHLSFQLGQVRRLLRIDRLVLILKDYLLYMRRKKWTAFDCFLMVFKAMICVQDLTDVHAFSIQLGFREGSILHLRRRVANLYFIQCLGWLVNYIHEYLHSKDPELRQKNMIVILRYVLDVLISHNEFSKKFFSLNSKIVSILGVLSSVLNIFLVWK